MKNRIKVQRAIKNITQDQLANELGVSRQTINAIELSKYSPSAALALKMARFFEVKVEEIFELEDGD